MFGWARGAKIDRDQRPGGRSEPAARRGRFWGLAILVAAWWLLLAAIVVSTMPESASSAPKVTTSMRPGQVARIKQPGLRSWPIPVERAAFDTLRRAYRESDEEAIERASTSTAWISLAHGQAVRVEIVDGDAVQVTVLEGEETGRQGWLLTRQLSN
jgi:hypothetical protein